MASNAQRGAYYKARSKRWLQKRGRTVFDLEIQRVVFTPNGLLPTKRDQLGADLGYLDADVTVFLQVKGGLKPTRALVRDALRAFAPYRFPTYSRQELHVWRPRATRPIVATIGDGGCLLEIETILSTTSTTMATIQTECGATAAIVRSGALPKRARRAASTSTRRAGETDTTNSDAR